MKPDLLSIFGIILTTSKLTKTQFSDNTDLFRTSIISSMLLVSFIFELSLSANRSNVLLKISHYLCYNLLLLQAVDYEICVF